MYSFSVMELAHSLLLNEAALQQVADSKRPIFIYEWLRFLEKVLGAAQKSDIKECQQKLVTQLLSQVTFSFSQFLAIYLKVKRLMN